MKLILALGILLSGEAFSKDIPSKLTLPFVLKAAIQNADSYQALQAKDWEADSSFAARNAGLDFTVISQFSYLNQKADTATPFSPSGLSAKQWEVGVKKAFITGTALQAGYRSAFNTISFSGGGTVVPDYYENTFFASVSQNLWADFLGIASRARSKKFELRGRALELEALEARDRWTMDLFDLYYRSWMAQNNFFAAQDNLERRTKLLETMKIKVRKGTAERPDLLQVQSAQLFSKNQLSQAKADLDAIWKSLIVTLKLDPRLARFPPEKVPMELNGLPAESERICAKKVSPENTVAVERAKFIAEAAAFGLEKAQSEKNPKLQLLGSYESNGINRFNNIAREEAWGRDHPTWKAMLQLEVPLGFSAQDSELQQARANALVAKTAYSSTLDNKKIELEKNCDLFERSLVELKDIQSAFAAQKERLELEESRFRLGRSTTTQVIQAGDDRTQAIQAKNAGEVRLRQLAWKVIQSTETLASYREKWNE